jgi:hypothetical protein
MEPFDNGRCPEHRSPYQLSVLPGLEAAYAHELGGASQTGARKAPEADCGLLPGADRYLYHSATPPWCEQVPLWCLE